MIQIVGFDGDDTLWRSQEFYDQAQLDFEAIIARYIDLDSEAAAVVTARSELAAASGPKSVVRKSLRNRM